MQEVDTKVQQEHTPSQSKLIRKSIGHAAHNLPLDSNKLEVYPVEEVGYVDGEINDHKETIEMSGVDAQGNEYSDVITTSNAVVAEWLPWGSNRHTAPNVRRGEKVILWQYADVDKYYWTIMGTEPHLRRLETVVYTYSNTRDESVTALDSSNSYSVIISTHTKEMTVQTTKSDGETFEYIAKIDAANGHFVVTDDAGNQIAIESNESRVSLHNSAGSSVVLDKKNITMTAPDKIELNAKTVKVNTQTHEINAKSSTLKSQTYNVNSTTTAINSDKFGLVGGTMDLSGGGLIVGTGSQFRGTLTSNGVDISGSHRHNGVKGGGDTSGTPV